jgi:hypothetical protein
MWALLAAFGWAAALAAPAPAGERDTDRDGLSDFHETHKYFTDPAKADSDGDGVPDGEWDERREFTYSVRAVMHVMAPFDVASMCDDYQDVRVLEQGPDLLEFEVVVYPFNTLAQSIEPAGRLPSEPAADLRPFVAPGVCGNWDEPMRKALLTELEGKGIQLDELDDVAAAKAVSSWLMERSTYEDGFTTFAFEFEGGAPKVSPLQADEVEATLQRFGRTLEEQLDRELFGKGMFTTRTHGSCTSSAIYLSTGLRAAGIPTRTIVCVPIVDSSDAREVAWIDERIEHVGVRAVLRASAEEQRGSWTSHTFNEVHVGGRWRRLNYTVLGQNVLDRRALGLMVHVHTFGDHAQAGLVGWGNRRSHLQHAALFGGPNPYSCISLSDRFGPHSKIANEPLAGLREVAIARLYWYEDPEKDATLTTDLGPSDGAGHFFAHLVVPASVGSDELMQFFRDADKRFLLRAPGREDLPAVGLRKYWVNGERGINDFILRIAPDDYARMEPGVPYALVWSGAGDGLAWKIGEGVSIAKPAE